MRLTLFSFAALSSTSARRPTMYTVAPLFSRAVAIINPRPNYDKIPSNVSLVEVIGQSFQRVKTIPVPPPVITTTRPLTSKRFAGCRDEFEGMLVGPLAAGLERAVDVGVCKAMSGRHEEWQAPMLENQILRLFQLGMGDCFEESV
jgi:hypothetical protein